MQLSRAYNFIHRYLIHNKLSNPSGLFFPIPLFLNTHHPSYRCSCGKMLTYILLHTFIDEINPSRQRPVAVHDQIVTDDSGRRRLVVQNLFVCNLKWHTPRKFSTFLQLYILHINKTIQLNVPGVNINMCIFRFHGAFTGGFSAGYYNSVGSKDGWTPSTFVSSRNDKFKNAKSQPEDFMDEEVH